MNRRSVITLAIAVVAAWPWAARAHPSWHASSMRRLRERLRHARERAAKAGEPPRPPAAGTTATAALLLALGAAPASATILTFDQVRSAAAGNPVIPTVSGRDVPLDYGDRVSAGAMAVPGGQFTYGEAGEGFTPNVDVALYSGAATLVGPAVSLWQDGYGDLVNVLIANNNSSVLVARLTADAGFEVGLLGFDLAGWPNADYRIAGVRVFDGADLLFEQTDVLVEGDFNGPRHSPFSFAGGLYARELLLAIDFGNLPGGQHDNIGLDNLRFAQALPGGGTSPVPEPGTLSLLGLGLVGGWAALRRRDGSRP